MSLSPSPSWSWSRRRFVGVVVLLASLATGCSQSASASAEPSPAAVPTSGVVDFVVDATMPVDHEGAAAAMAVSHFVSSWLVERCPGHHVFDLADVRPDQTLWPDFDRIKDHGLGLGQPAPAILAASEQQIDPAAFDLDGDPEVISEQEALSMQAEIQGCSDEQLPELAAATDITADWYGEVVYPLAHSQSDQVLAAIDCLRGAAISTQAPAVDSLAAFFFTLDHEVAGIAPEGFADQVARLEDLGSAAYVSCTQSYFEDWLHPQLAQERSERLDQNLDAVQAFARALEARGFTIS